MISEIASKPASDALVSAKKVSSAWFSASNVLLCALLMFAPLAFGAVQPWAWTALVILSIVAFVLWSVGCAKTGIVLIRQSQLYTIALLSLCLVTGQFAFGKTQDFVGSRESLIKLLGYCAIFFLAGQISMSSRNKRWLGLSILVYVFAISIFAIVQFFTSSGLIYWTIKPRWGGWIFGPYVNHNHYAGLLEILLPIAAVSALELSRRLQVRVLSWFSVSLGFVSVLLSGSRGGSIAVMIELLLLVSILGSGGIRQKRVAIIAGLTIAIVATGTFIWLDPGSLSRRWEATADARDLGAGARVNFSNDSIRMFRENPVIGIGAGAFETAYPKFQSWPSDYVIDHAHNDYLELLAETGILGGALLVAVLFIFFQQTYRVICQLPINRAWMQVGAAVGCCGLLIHSFTDFNLHIPANAAWFCAAAGLTISNQVKGIAESKDSI